MAKTSAVLFSGLVLIASAAAAHADLKISTKLTQNVSCAGGVCTPTAKKAILNVTDLANMLAAGDATVNTAGKLAQNIQIDAALTWTGTSRLTLDAYRSIAFNKPVTVAGTGALTIATNDGGSGGDFRFFGKGHVHFWDTKSSLIINGQSYRLTKSLKNLRYLVRHNVDGFYALAKDIDAHGRQYSPAVLVAFDGILEGLGNVISNVTIAASADRTSVAFIGDMGDADAVVRDVGLANATVVGSGTGCVAALVGTTHGTIMNSYATGKVSAESTNSIAGGLICDNEGNVRQSWANVLTSGVGDNIVGGLVGVDEGGCSDLCHSPIDQSYAIGVVSGGDSSMVGGLVGRNLGGSVGNSYATGAASGGNNAFVGGLIGSNENNSEQDTHPFVGTSYSTGPVTGGTGAVLGGLMGQDIAAPNITDTYWDLDTSGISDPHQGAGNVPDDPGIIGLSDGQLKAALPPGFLKSIWGQSSIINAGYPYLLASPTQ